MARAPRVIPSLTHRSKRPRPRAWDAQPRGRASDRARAAAWMGFAFCPAYPGPPCACPPRAGAGTRAGLPRAGLPLLRAVLAVPAVLALPRRHANLRWAPPRPTLFTSRCSPAIADRCDWCSSWRGPSPSFPFAASGIGAVCKGIPEPPHSRARMVESEAVRDGRAPRRRQAAALVSLGRMASGLP